MDKSKYKKDDPLTLASIGELTTIKSYFMLEFKQYEEGTINPVVYSRDGKKAYSSDEKLDPKKFDEYKSNTFFVNVKSLINKNEIDLTTQKMRSDPSTAFISPDPYYRPIDINDNTLVFESRFESGNLNLAIKMSEDEYNLVL